MSVAALCRVPPRLLGGVDVSGRLWDPIWACPSTAGRVSSYNSSGADLIAPTLLPHPLWKVPGLCSDAVWSAREDVKPHRKRV